MAHNLIFVGGYPRSGTTLTHAVICTSQSTNGYHPEVSYLRMIFQSYQVGVNNWGAHTRHLFTDLAAFRSTFSQIIDQCLAAMAPKLGTPPIWCMKDPLLTPYFHWVSEVLADRVRLVTVIRHPHDAIRSNIEVTKKMKGATDAAAVREMAERYNLFYQHIDNAALGQKLMVIRYEDLDSEAEIARLRQHTGLADINPQEVWKDRTPAKDESNPWFSPKYNAPIDLSPRLAPLSAADKKIVDTTCAALLKRFYS